jgi:hypothetical protein
MVSREFSRSMAEELKRNGTKQSAKRNNVMMTFKAWIMLDQSARGAFEVTMIFSGEKV